jgi:hypothetical protein
MLLDINRNMRRLFDKAEANSGEAKMRQLFGEKPAPRTFDEAFKPLMGWDSI